MEYQHKVMKEIEKEETSIKKTNPKTLVETNIKEIAEILANQYIHEHLDIADIEKEAILEVAATELNYMVCNLMSRWRNKFNYVHFLTQTVVIQLTKHFESQQMYFSNEDNNATFLTFSYLKSPECEEQYIRRLATVLARYLLPEEYQRSSISQILAQDILTKFLILPIINQVTDPHFLNLQCIANLKKENAENLDSILFTRRPIVKSGEKTYQLSPDKILFDGLTESTTDEEALQKALTSLKQNIDLIVDTDIALLLQSKTACQDILERNKKNNLASILSNPIKRRFMSEFLDKRGSRPLLSLWEEIERMEGLGKQSSMNIGSCIFLTYLTPVSVLAFDKDILQRVENYLLSGLEKDQEVFLQIQTEISKHIETYFYSDFCVSDFYLEMVRVCGQDQNTSDNYTSYLRRAFKSFRLQFNFKMTLT